MLYRTLQFLILVIGTVLFTVGLVDRLVFDEYIVISLLFSTLPAWFFIYLKERSEFNFASNLGSAMIYGIRVSIMNFLVVFGMHLSFRTIFAHFGLWQITDLNSTALEVLWRFYYTPLGGIGELLLIMLVGAFILGPSAMSIFSLENLGRIKRKNVGVESNVYAGRIEDSISDGDVLEEAMDDYLEEQMN